MERIRFIINVFSRISFYKLGRTNQNGQKKVVHYANVPGSREYEKLSKVYDCYYHCIIQYRHTCHSINSPSQEERLVWIENNPKISNLQSTSKLKKSSIFSLLNGRHNHNIPLVIMVVWTDAFLFWPIKTTKE